MHDEKKQKHSGSGSAREADSDEGNAAITQAQRQGARQRKLAARAKQALHEQAHRALEGAQLGANLFQMMVRKDGEDELNKKLHPDAAEKVAHMVIDKVAHKLREGLVEISDVGKAMADKATTIFGAIHGSISDKIKTTQELTVSTTADFVTTGLLEAQTIANENLRAHIDSLPTEKLAIIAEQIWKLREVARASPFAEGDSAEHGNLADGAEEMFMTDMLGMPQGGGVAAEAIALQAYSEFQAGLRAHAMSAGERATAIQHRLANPNGDRDTLNRVENEQGEHTKAGIERDVAQKRRTDMAFGGGT
jgi:hypothetical protein